MSKRKPSDPAELRTGDLPKDEDRRKRKAESDVVETVAGAMAGEVLAAVTGKARKRKE